MRVRPLTVLPRLNKFPSTEHASPHTSIRSSDEEGRERGKTSARILGRYRICNTAVIAADSKANTRYRKGRHGNQERKCPPGSASPVCT